MWICYWDTPSNKEVKNKKKPITAVLHYTWRWAACIQEPEDIYEAAELWAEKEYVCVLCLGVAIDLQEDRGS